MYERSAEVDVILAEVKGQGGVRGIVSPIEVRRLCGRIRELRRNRHNVLLESDKKRLVEYCQLHRCFTLAEADDIDWLYGQFQQRTKRAEKQKGD